MTNCRICDNQLIRFLDFGKMPIANGFLTKKEYEFEYFFKLEIGFCPECTMVQLINQPEREKMFHDNYAYFSSISTRMEIHFKKFANLVMSEFLKEKDPFLVEIGSNDGIMLKHFALEKIRHLGVEPSANVCEAAQKQGIDTICEFFDEALAKKILSDHGPANAVIAANVMCHIPYLHSITAGIDKLLSKSGVLIFEDPYLGDIIEKVSYDQIYDEHAFYFSITSIEKLFDPYGLEVIDVQPQNVHGGSMRYFIARKGVYPIKSTVAEQKRVEKKLGLREQETFHRFRKQVEISRDTLKQKLENLKNEKKRVVGYGATSKSTTVTNYCNITPDLVDFISDTTPTKQGKFNPGTHIPVRPYTDFQSNPPDVGLLFAWNHGEEIMNKESAFRKDGGKWLVYVPEVEII